MNPNKTKVTTTKPNLLSSELRIICNPEMELKDQDKEDESLPARPWFHPLMQSVAVVLAFWGVIPFWQAEMDDTYSNESEAA